MKTLKIENSKITYRENIWDTELFNIPTFEILDLQGNLENFPSLLKEIDIKESNAVLMIRCDANDLDTKRALMSEGFQVMETSLDLYLAITSNYKIPSIYSKKLVNLVEATVKQQLEIKSFIGSTFNYSRFHEDPLFDGAKASKRMEKRVDVFLAQSEYKCLIHETPDGEVVSFIYYRQLENEVYFELGGSKNGKGHYTPFFWASLINYFKTRNVKKIRTRISAANIGVANIYWSFGFKIKSTVLDCHKHIT